MPKKEYSDYKKFSEHKLLPNEKVITYGVGYIGEMMGSGKDRQHNGCLIVTNQRVVFYSKGWLSEVFEEISHSKISSVFTKSLMGFTTVTIHTSGNNLEFKSLIKEEVDELINCINELKGEKPTNTLAQKSEQHDSPIALLQKVAELHKNGILSDEEFKIKKEELLKRIS